MMDYEAAEKCVEHKRQAFAALKEIMHLEHIKVALGDLGEHYAMWIIYTGHDNKEFRRQLSWDKYVPSHDGIRLQWIYDALWEYHRLKEAVRALDQKEEVNYE